MEANLNEGFKNSLKRIRIFLPLIITSGAIWSLAMFIFFISRYWVDAGIDTIRIRNDFPLETNPLLRIMLEAFFFGVISELVELLVFKQRFNSLTSPVSALIKTGAQFLLFLTYISASLAARHYINFETFHNSLDPMLAIFKEGYALQLILFFSLITLSMGIVRQLYHLIGPLNLRNFILGWYSVPREEERIFLFLDLNSATTLAETLGDKKYSRLLQDCFTDLSDLSYFLRAQSYQYVGDEAVFTWLKTEGFRNERCLRLFFRFKIRLLRREKYYMSKYGIMPTFKAAMHCGRTIGAEVGQVKKEIAFHGDAINTTSRILDKCHELEEEFLISEDLLEGVRNSKRFKFEDKGDAHLKGKFQSLKLYGVRRP